MVAAALSPSILYRSPCVPVPSGPVNVTPSGADPPALGMAVTVLPPPLGPTFQHTPAFPLASVTVVVELPDAPHETGESVSGAIVPPPESTLHSTGTPTITTPRCVVTRISGRHAALTSVLTVVAQGSAIMAAVPPVTAVTPEVGLRDVVAPTPAAEPAAVEPVASEPAAAEPVAAEPTPGVVGPVFLNSLASPPTPRSSSSGSTAPNGLNSDAKPPTPRSRNWRA